MKVINYLILYSILIFCVNSNLLCNDTTKTDVEFPRFYAGLQLPVSFNFNSGGANSIGENHYCCKGINFDDNNISAGWGLTSGIDLGNFDSLFLLNRISYGSVLTISHFSNNLNGNSIEVPRKVYLGENEIGELIESNRVEIQSNYIKLFWGFSVGTAIDSSLSLINFKDRQPMLNLSFGPIIAINTSNDAKQYVEIRNTKDFQYLNSKRSILIASGEVTNMQDVLFGLGASMNCKWNLKQFIENVSVDNIELDFGLSWHYFISNTLDNQEMGLNQVIVLLGLNWIF